MCGIAGVFSMDGAPIDHDVLARMTLALSHRGPDAHGLHVEPGLGLGHRRLSVLDPGGGAQPMCNDDGVVLVFNGEIYNFAAMRDELAARGHRFSTRSDTEVILRGWEAWGPDVVQRLDGMFAFALWDKRARRLFLARDRLGKKPLYYAALPGGLAFASELASFASVPGVRREIDPAALHDYLALGYVPDPATIWAGIHKLPPAHTLLIEMHAASRGLPAPGCYWRPEAGTDIPGFEAAAEMLRDRLLHATAARLVADVPLGAFLSGGLDSAGVVAAAMRVRDRADPIDSFTIGFAGAEDESPAAAAIAAHCGASHAVERAGGIDWIAASADQGRVFGEPFGDPSAVPTARLCRFARRHVTVALSGDGGDEVFAGYRRHRWHMLVESLRRQLPPAMRRGPIATLARLYPKLDRAPRFLRARHTLTELSLDSALGYYRTMARLQDERRAALLHPTLAARLDGHDPGARFARLMQESGSDDPLAQAQHVDLATWLPGQMLTKLDRTSMASGLEVRSPLLDHRLVSWGLSLPADYKLRRGRGKAVLRAAIAPWLPPEILQRPKQGFAMDLRRTLGAGMGRIRARLLSPDFLDHALFRPDAVARLLDEHASGRLDHAQPIWLLLVLDGFLRSELAAAPAMVEAA
ncbi:asparagine synthase (glutamine-hydrolyzing) [Lichenicola sp.]|uniref:asparagine synthase (glutamine-hydrolyzing) n=1 Tax=Lichenicola sp. TaxID=2804529 RepID=UPI003B009AC8